MWSVGGSALSISGVGTKMGLRRYRVPTRRLFGSHTLGGISVHFYVDLRRSLSGYQVYYNYVIKNLYHTRLYNINITIHRYNIKIMN